LIPLTEPAAGPTSDFGDPLVGVPVVIPGQPDVIPAERRDVSEQRIVHGTTLPECIQHFPHTGRVLPPGYEPKVVHGGRMPTVARLDLPFFERLFAPLGQAQWQSIGGRAFGYAFAPATDDPDATLWFLSFFGRLTFLAFTVPD
jgi:hypothetical protein